MDHVIEAGNDKSADRLVTAATLGPARCLGGVGPIGRNVVHPDPESKKTFASPNLTLDAQSQQESHVKWTSLCIEPNAKSLKLFNPQSQPKMPSDTARPLAQALAQAGHEVAFTTSAFKT